MAGRFTQRSSAGLLTVVAVATLAAACSSSSSTSASGGSSTAPAATSTGAASAAPGSAAPGTGAPAAGLGTPNAATGTPVVFGVLNLDSGPVTFPEAYQAEQAAVSYVNDYKGGIGGHPIKLVECATDGSPSTSQRCANQILDQHPVAILGGADTGAPGAIPVWQRAGLDYLGGIPFTPAEQNYANAAIFSSVSSADNAAASIYAAKTLGVKKAAVIYTSDTQGTQSAVTAIIQPMTAAGITSITKIAIPPTSSDVSSAVATAVGAHPDLIYVDAPAACPNILASLKQLGNTAKIMGIDPCTSPPAIAGANGGADGLYFAGPTLDPHSGTAETSLYLAAVAKYQPKLILDSIATIGFQSVIDVQAALATFTTADLTGPKILAAFKTGTAEHNFMGHDYVCDGKQLALATAVCNSYEQIRQVKGTSITVASPTFVTPGPLYTGKG